MRLDDIKMRLEEVAGQASELEQAELQSCAELGRLLLPELGEGKYADIASRIKAGSAKLAALKEERASLEAEQRRLLAELTCFACKTVNPEGAVFCEECGQKLGVKPKEYCEACGTMNHPGQKFCGECGARLAAD